MVKKTIGFVLLFSIFPLVIGILCFWLKNDFIAGFKTGIYTDLLCVAVYGFIKSIEWAFDTEII